MTPSFVVHERLAQDSLLLGSFELSQVRLILDARYPWLILVPRRPNITAIDELAPADRMLLIEESCKLAELMRALWQPARMNVAALGNMVPQLHLHHIARFETDDAWPGAVWGAHPALVYTASALASRKEQLIAALSKEKAFEPEVQAP